MDKRQTKRITAGYKAEITYEDKTYQGIVENLSEKGASITIVISEPGIDFQRGKTLDLKFEIRPGETLSLKCTIVWSSKLPPHGVINALGLEVKDPPWEECKSCL